MTTGSAAGVGRRPAERQRPDRAGPHRPRRPAGRGGDRPRPTPATSRSTDDAGSRGPRHARLRPRHPHDLPGRHRPRDGGAEGPLARHARPHRPARRGEIGAAPGDARRTACSPASPSPTSCLALHVDADCRPARSASPRGYAMANVDSVDVVDPRQAAATAPRRTRRSIPIVHRRPDRPRPADDRQPRDATRTDPAVVTVGSIHGGTKHNIIPDEVKLQTHRPHLQGRGPASRSSRAIERIASGQAIAAGLPEDRMPTGQVRNDAEFTPADTTRRNSSTA